MPTDHDPRARLNAVEPPLRRQDALRFAALFDEVTGYAPVLWSDGAIGYGSYSYRYASGRSGRYFATGFAVRAREFSVHILPDLSAHGALLDRLGRHRAARSCLYLRSLDDVDHQILSRLVAAGLAELRRHWPVEAS